MFPLEEVYTAESKLSLLHHDGLLLFHPNFPRPTPRKDHIIFPEEACIVVSMSMITPAAAAAHSMHNFAQRTLKIPSWEPHTAALRTVRHLNLHSNQWDTGRQSVLPNRTPIPLPTLNHAIYV